MTSTPTALPTRDDLARREAELALKRNRLAAQAAELQAQAKRLEEEIARLTPAPPVAPSKPIAQKPPASPKPVASPPALASPAPAIPKPPVQEPAAQDPEPSENPPGPTFGQRLHRSIRGAPPWLLSMVVHTAALIVLAVLSVAAIPFQEEQLPLVSDRATSTEDVEQMQEVELKLDEVQDDSALVGDVGLADLGDLAAVVESDLAGDVDVGRLEVNDSGIGLAMDGLKLGKGLDGLGMGTGKATFFGTAATGNRFVFVVDNSKSMNGGKFEKACAEIARSVENLKPHQSFYVIFFSDKDYCLFYPEPVERYVPATPANIIQLKKWMSETQLYGKTKALESMQKAMALQPDAIFLLTDGKFGDKTEALFTGKDSPNPKRYDLDSDDPRYGTQIPINTIGFVKRDGEPTLKNIAEKNSGTYRFVP